MYPRRLGSIRDCVKELAGLGPKGSGTCLTCPDFLMISLVAVLNVLKASLICSWASSGNQSRLFP
jgi:hypothetical protein